METSFSDPYGMVFVESRTDTRTINQVAKDEELRCAYDQIAKLTAVLVECRQFAEQYVDIVDSDNGPAPNKAMRLVCAIDESLYGMLGAF